MKLNLKLTSAGLVFALLLVGLPAAGADSSKNFDLPATGILLEGIGLDDDADVIYVSGVNDGGDIYRGELGTNELELWVDSSGTTGRGIDVDEQGRVFVAGGPTGTVRIFGPEGNQQALLANGAAGSFLNDVWVGPDGSVYVTDSSLPTIWRLVETDGSWSIEAWLDVSSTITFTEDPSDFDLGGIVTTKDGRFLLTSQGTTGQLWRIDLVTQEISEVDLGGVQITNADGIVLKGKKLWVVQNFLRQVSQFRLSNDASSGELRDVQATNPDQTFTTAVLARGRLFAVDSQFGFNPADAPAQDRVVALRKKS